MFKITKLCVSLLLALSRSALAGSGAHGADIDADQNNTWFLGQSPIPYCLVLEKGSPLDRQALRSQIRAAFAEWKAFLLHYGYGSVSFGVPDPSFKLALEFSDHKVRAMSLDAVELDRCDDADHQLEIRFSKDSEEGWSLDSDHAMGAAIRGPYDHKSFRTGGTVWVSTTLTTESERKHILLHELGHVFGMPHNSTYVMYEKVGKLIQLSRTPGMTTTAGTPLGTIESPSWKYLLNPGDSLTVGSTVSPQQRLAFSLSEPKFLSGGIGLFPAPSGAKLTYMGRDSSSGFHEFNLTFRTGREQFTLRGKFQWRYHQYEVGPSIHTEWVRDGKKVAGRFFLELMAPKGRQSVGGGSKQHPLEGTFSYEGRVFPAIIEFPFGGVVKLFHTPTARWYSFAAYPFEVSP